jgi:uncharacterized protein
VWLKVLIFVVVAFVIYLRFFHKPRKRNTPPPPPDHVMVECMACDTFVDAKDAIIQDGRYFCCKECARSVSHKR